MALYTETSEVTTTIDGQKKSEEIEVAQFENFEDAVEYFTNEDAEDEGEAREAAEEYVVGLINSQHKTNEQNSARQRLKGRSPINALRKKASEDPEAQAAIMELCNKLGISI